jgi:hypothetical protein
MHQIIIHHQIHIMKEQTIRKGFRSAKNGHLGVYTLCSGPDPSGPVPGERLIIVIYDKDNTIVRRLEQVQGDCIDEGYVDFFNSFQCRPARFAYHMIDIDRVGHKQILATHYTSGEVILWLKENVPVWVDKHGIPQ